MKINFRYMTLEEVSSVLAWSSIIDDGILPLSEYAFSLYPELKQIGNLKDIDYIERVRVISNVIKENYEESIDLFKNKKTIEHYQDIWSKYNDIYFKTLSNYFKVSIEKDIDASIGLIPVCPRDISSLSFSIHGLNDEDLIDACMHECCHFYFYKLCENIFKDLKEDDYENPSLLWYLSEICIDPVLNKEEFQNIFKHKFRTYDNFYKVFINDECIVDTIKNIFENNNIETSIKMGLHYITNNKMEFISKCNNVSNDQIINPTK